MGDVKGFMKHGREVPTRRPVPVRLLDWHEVYEQFPEDHLQAQASRCMDCGIPFCNNGCPLGNLIPDWNDLVWRDNWAAMRQAFAAVTPRDFKRVRAAEALARAEARQPAFSDLVGA